MRTGGRIGPVLWWLFWDVEVVSSRANRTPRFGLERILAGSIHRGLIRYKVLTLIVSLDECQALRIQQFERLVA